MSDTNSYQEHPGVGDGYIIPTTYYDKYPLVFSHYHLDRVIARIGMNEKQRKAIINRGSADSTSGVRQATNAWYSPVLPRDRDRVRQSIITSKIPASQNMLN